jgi:leucyl-tRNA synthetase
LPTDTYVFATSPAVGDELDAGRLRGFALADAHARYRRACGDEVLFAVAFDTLAADPAPAAGQDAAAWAQARCGALREQLEALAVSLDWERSLRTDGPELTLWSQWLLVKLLEAGLAYRRGAAGGWHLHGEGYAEENARRVAELEGWDDAARAVQRGLLARVEGVEVEGQTLDGAPLTLFTPHPDRIGSAEFVALSPHRPELDEWVADDGLRRQLAEQRARDWDGVEAARRPVVEIGLSVQVPGVAQPLPVLVSTAVDARYGSAAIVGIPSADEADRALARDLAKAGGMAWKTAAKPPRTTPASRGRLPDMPLSREHAWGAPVPVVHCDACGAVPLAVADLPLEQPQAAGDAADGPAGDADRLARDCPRCGAAARRDSATIHPRVGAALGVVALAVPAAELSSAPPDHSGSSRWLPTARTVAGPDAGVALLDARTLAKALRDLGPTELLAAGEPHGPTAMHGALLAEGETSAGELVERFGADALRFALLHAAAPGKRVAVGEPACGWAAAFLERVRALAGRIEGAALDGRIDAGDGLRRRLASWCDTAVERMAENYERLDLHRATRNAVTLLDRIEDFDRRVVSYRGELAGADREAAAIALGTLLRLLAPIAPACSDELLAGATDRWPQRQREPAPA